VDHADAVYTNGRIYTVDQARPWAEALAIKDGKLVEVGDSIDVERLIGEDTVKFDLGGRFVMPGIYDTHLHPGDDVRRRTSVNIKPTDSWEVVRQAIEDYLTEHPDVTWVTGAALNWLMDDGEPIKGMGVPSHKSVLDAVVSDRPAILADIGYHAVLVNSRALELAGITRETPDPEGGIIVRDAAGEPTGVLRERAGRLVHKLVDRAPPELLYEKGLKPFVQDLAREGIVGIGDAGGGRNMEADYLKLVGENALPLSVTGFSSVRGWDTRDDVAFLSVDAHEQHPLVRTIGAKFILDGSAVGETMVMLEPYVDTDFRGELLVNQPVYSEQVRALDQEGVLVKSHAVGTRAVRVALDAFQEARRVNPDGPRHSVAHTVLVHPDDIPRFAELGVVAEVSPTFWFPGDTQDILERDLGHKRTELAWPVRELIETGAVVAYGSDWPVSYAISPWDALETLVTRQRPGGSDDTWGAEHAVDLETAIKILTLNGAYSLEMEAERGSIAVGKWADVIVLDRDIFEVPITEVHETRVQKTVFEGNVVFERVEEELP